MGAKLFGSLRQRLKPFLCLDLEMGMKQKLLGLLGNTQHGSFKCRWGTLSLESGGWCQRMASHPAPWVQLTNVSHSQDCGSGSGLPLRGLLSWTWRSFKAPCTLFMRRWSHETVRIEPRPQHTQLPLCASRTCSHGSA